MTDSELVATYFPPLLLSEDEWMFLSVWGCRWTTISLRSCSPRPQQQFDLGSGCGKTSVFVLRAPWFWMVGDMVVCIVLVIELLLFAIFGFLGNVRMCQDILSLVCFTFPVLLVIITALSFATSSTILTGPQDSFFWWIHDFCYIFNAIVTTFFEHYLMILPSINWIVNSAALTINNQMVQEGGSALLSRSYLLNFCPIIKV